MRVLSAPRSSQTLDNSSANPKFPEVRIASIPINRIGESLSSTFIRQRGVSSSYLSRCPTRDVEAMKFLTLITPVLLLCLFVGCATTSSVGDQMVDRGKSAKKLGRDWNKGERMVKKGERYLAESEKLMQQSGKNAKKSETMQAEGEELLAQGRALMEKSESTYSTEFSDTQ